MLVVEFLRPPDLNPGDVAHVEHKGAPMRQAVVTRIDGVVAQLAIAANQPDAPALQSTRPPRFKISAPARLRSGPVLAQVQIIDLSRDGAKLDMAAAKADVCIDWASMIGNVSLLNIRGLSQPRLGAIRWIIGDRAGFNFQEPVTVPELDAILRAVSKAD